MSFIFRSQSSQSKKHSRSQVDWDSVIWQEAEQMCSHYYAKHRHTQTNDRRRLVYGLFLMLVIIGSILLSPSGRESSSQESSSQEVGTTTQPDDPTLLFDLTNLNHLTPWYHKIWPAYKINKDGTYCWRVDTSKGTLGLPLSQPGVIYTIEMDAVVPIPPSYDLQATRSINVWGEVLASSNAETKAHRNAFSADTGGPILLSSFRYGPISVHGMQDLTVLSQAHQRAVRKVILEVDEGWRKQKNLCLRTLRVYGIVLP
ncbi:hypothetical protein CPB86DRAFT_783723 [Serendipita vermifera]|nr:hypothetical protein CPB86DRAFT_783723 [Serendipita vermifera]